MRTVLLNTSILTTYGTFTYHPATLDEVRAHLQAADETGIPIISAIGHASTAEILTGLLNRPVDVNRIEFRQEPGDVAVVFKMRGRPPEGKILSSEEIESIGYDFGMLAMQPDR
jgi:hypothetical protein